MTNNDKLTTTSEAEISKRLDDIFGDDESFDNSENTQFESSPNTNNIKQNVYSKDNSAALFVKLADWYIYPFNYSTFRDIFQRPTNR